MKRTPPPETHRNTNLLQSCLPLWQSPWELLSPRLEDSELLHSVTHVVCSIILSPN